MNIYDALLPQFTQDFPWCTTDTSCYDTDDAATLEMSSMKSAYIPPGAVWKDHQSGEVYKELHVKFDEIPAGWTCGDGEHLNTANILGWANEWNLRGEGKIPLFRIAKPGNPAQIRVSFNGIIIYNSMFQLLFLGRLCAVKLDVFIQLG